MMDLLRNDPAFGIAPLTDAINKLLYVPGRIGQLGLFQEQPVPATTILIEEKSGTLELVGPTPRGGPGHTNAPINRNIRPFRIPHFELDDAVMADEVQGVRAFGSETEVETLQGKIGEKLGLSNDRMAMTQEFSRLGAVRGIVTYADGSTLNLFTEFAVTPPAVVPLDLNAASPVPGTLRGLLDGLLDTVSDSIGAVPWSGLYAFVGRDFWRDLVTHPDVEKTFLNTAQAAELRASLSNPGQLPQGTFGRFEFGGVVWDSYRGKVGATDFVDPDEAHVFPIVQPGTGLFKTYYGPADYNETVNTMGKRLYAKQIPMDNDKGTRLETQMNALEICTRPGVLITLHRGAS